MYEKELLLLMSSHLSEDELQVICNPEDPVFITDVMIPPLFGQLIKLTHILMAPPSTPQVSG